MLSFEDEASVRKLNNTGPGGTSKNNKTYYQIPLDSEVSSIQPLLQQTSYDTPSHYQNRRCNDSKPKEKEIRKWEINTM